MQLSFTARDNAKVPAAVIAATIIYAIVAALKHRKTKERAVPSKNMLRKDTHTRSTPPRFIDPWPCDFLAQVVRNGA